MSISESIYESTRAIKVIGTEFTLTAYSVLRWRQRMSMIDLWIRLKHCSNIIKMYSGDLCYVIFHCYCNGTPIYRYQLNYFFHEQFFFMRFMKQSAIGHRSIDSTNISQSNSICLQHLENGKKTNLKNCHQSLQFGYKFSPFQMQFAVQNQTP